MAPEIDSPTPMAPDDTRTGYVDAGGTILMGDGFAVSRVATGVYEIVFEPPFAMTPRVVASQVVASVLRPPPPEARAIVLDVTERRVRVRNVDASGQAVDRRFCFVAMP